DHGCRPTAFVHSSGSLRGGTGKLPLVHRQSGSPRGRWARGHGEHRAARESNGREIKDMNRQRSTAVQKSGYRGKHFTLPSFSAEGGIYFEPEPEKNIVVVPADSPVIKTLNSVFDLKNFKVPRRPVSLGILTEDEKELMAANLGAPRTLDLPVKFPGSN